MSRQSALFVGALLVVSCGGPNAPVDRSGFYNLSLNSTFRDFSAERYFTCEVGFELDVRVPLPDTFTTVADARVRRTVVWDSGGEMAVDSVLREIPVRLERLRRAELHSPSRIAFRSCSVVRWGTRSLESVWAGPRAAMMVHGAAHP